IGTNHLLSIAILFGCLGWAQYWINTQILPVSSQFPKPVAKHMRKAIHFTSISFDPKKAVHYYREALREADKLGMDPFSDAIIGIKIKLAYLFEKSHLYQKSIDVLEILKADNLKWIEILGDKEGNEAKKTRVLMSAVRVSIKLAHLYANQYVMDKAKAEECLMWGVETSLAEEQRRIKEGVKPSEGEWFSSEEIGAEIEALAHHFEEKNAHYLAAPLFLQAIARSPPNTCHTVILMNNLAISLAQQVPPSMPGQPPASRATYISNARSWANQAISLAEKIPKSYRTGECDVGCAVATHNLGEFAEMDGNVANARKFFEQANAISKTIGFQEGVDNSIAGLARLAEEKKKD
ncbi:hypothetical protein HYFRA_00004306, partial [Hymenoscyphus fraxineus]